MKPRVYKITYRMYGKLHTEFRMFTAKDIDDTEESQYWSLKDFYGRLDATDVVVCSVG